jgi:Phage tail-collar fibre protein
MSAFGGLIMTNKGRILQTKAQTGVQLTFTRIALGDGSLSGQSILELNRLINEKKSLSITKLKTQPDGKAVVGAVLSNQDITTGFYFREIGVFAQDPDVGEILYCYGNAGATAEYIPAGGGPDIIEKNIDIITIVGNASNVSAVINSSLVYATQEELQNHLNDTNNPHNVTAAQIGAETPAGAQAKADQAEANANAYTDQKVSEHSADTTKHVTPAEKAAWNSAEANAKAYTDSAPEAMQRNLGVFNVYKSGKDENGIFTIVEYKRADGTLYARSVLSGGTSPQYTTRTITYYDNDGTTVLRTDPYTLIYDADGDLIGEVKQ